MWCSAGAGCQPPTSVMFALISPRRARHEHRLAPLSWGWSCAGRARHTLTGWLGTAAWHHPLLASPLASRGHAQLRPNRTPLDAAVVKTRAVFWVCAGHWQLSPRHSLALPTECLHFLALCQGQVLSAGRDPIPAALGVLRCPVGSRQCPVPGVPPLAARSGSFTASAPWGSPAALGHPGHPGSQARSQAGIVTQQQPQGRSGSRAPLAVCPARRHRPSASCRG